MHILITTTQNGKEVSILQVLLSAWHFPTHAALCLLIHGRHSLCLNSRNWSVPSFFCIRFQSLHFYNLWEVCPSEMWVRISSHRPLSHKLLEKATKEMAKYPCPMYWELYYKDISVLLIQRYSVVPPDNKSKDDEYNICRVSFPG